MASPFAYPGTETKTLFLSNYKEKYGRLYFSKKDDPLYPHALETLSSDGV